MNATQYLEAAKIEEVTSQFRSQGFEVTFPNGEQEGFDLVGTRGSERIAVVVKAGSELRHSASEIARLRDQARRDGYSFRLIVVNPPREKAVDVEGLRQRLEEYVSENPPHELNMLSSHTRITDISNLEVDSLEATTDGLHVVGNGVIDVELDCGGGIAKDGVTSEADFPFTFDVLLDHTLHIKEVRHLNVDTSSFYE